MSTQQFADGRTFPELTGAGTPLPKRSKRDVRRGHVFGVRTGQLVSSQAAIALVAVGLLGGPFTLAASVFVAIILISATWLRLQRRWAFEWLAIALSYSVRRHAVAATGSPTALLDLVLPGARVERAQLAGEPAAVIVCSDGLIAVLELGDPTGLLVEGAGTTSPPTGLLPASGADQPPFSIQLLLTGAPAPRAGGGIPANSYRQLTEGRLLGYGRAMLAIRAQRTEGWTVEELHHALSGLIRRLTRRSSTLHVRPLGEPATLEVLAELAHTDAAGHLRENWQGLSSGEEEQSTYRLMRWPDLRLETARRLIPRMLVLPATATTVSLAAGPRSSADGEPPVAMTVRLAAPDQVSLQIAAEELSKLIVQEGGAIRRVDGEHLGGLTATLPLAHPAHQRIPGRASKIHTPDGPLDALDLPVPGSGLVIGRNRHRQPVVVRLFRPEQTRAVFVGGVRGAQLIVLRAMAVGARIVVQTTRPHAWEPFARGAAVPGESIALIPPGQAAPFFGASALHPLLHVLDVGPVAADDRSGPAWHATLVVRDDLDPADNDIAVCADLLLVQRLRPDEADLLGTALSLGDTTALFTRIRPDMLGVINRRAIRWAALSPTPIETRVIGNPARPQTQPPTQIQTPPQRYAQSPAGQQAPPRSHPSP